MSLAQIVDLKVEDHCPSCTATTRSQRSGPCTNAQKSSVIEAVLFEGCNGAAVPILLCRHTKVEHRVPAP